MRRLERDDIVDASVYEGQRPKRLSDFFEMKKVRRLELVENLVLFFENTQTMRLRTQELVRARSLLGEEEIRREIAECNSFLGGPGHLACTFSIENTHLPQTRWLLRNCLAISRQIYLRLANGQIVRAHRISTGGGSSTCLMAQHLLFDVGGEAPVAIGCDEPGLQIEVQLTRELLAALANDLSWGRSSAELSS